MKSCITIQTDIILNPDFEDCIEYSNCFNVFFVDLGFTEELYCVIKL